MESEGIFHQSRGRTYQVPTPKGVPPNAAAAGKSFSSSSSTSSASSTKRSLHSDVADGIPESLVEEGVEADNANRLCGVEAPTVDAANDTGNESATGAASADPLPDGLFFRDGFLSFASRDCLVFPLDFVAKFAGETKKLDLSFNALVNVKGLEVFAELEELMLDNNQLTDDVNFPNLPKLKTLSVNKNRIADLDRFVSMCRWKFPALTFLSLVGNECCPGLTVAAPSGDDQDADEYQRYRYAVIYKIPGLKFVDFTPVTDKERAEAARRGKFISTVKVDEKALDSLLATQAAEAAAAAAGGGVGKKGKNKTGQEKDYSPLPQPSGTAKTDGVAAKDTKEAYGKCRFVYYGKQSEGNRFISNDTL